MKPVLLAVVIATFASVGAAMADNTVAANSSSNLVTNAGFGLGNVDFSSDYTYAYPSQPGYSQFPETQYEITTNTSLVRPNGSWGAFNGPEAGESFLMINGATSKNPDLSLKNFWDESIKLAADKTYNLSFDVADAGAVTFPLVELTLNGATVGSQVYYGDGPQGFWTTETFTFNSGLGGSEKIGLADANLDAYGNDFAVTNISLVTAVVPEPGTWAMLTLGLGMVGFAVRLRRPASAV